jgi:DNA (cytosine-5)-methyltransferase 1
VKQPLDTVTSKARFGMVVPVTNSNGGQGPRDLADPLPTMTTAKGGEFAMVTPSRTPAEKDRAQDVETPLPTVTGANRGELAFITAAFGEREGQAPRVHDIDQPAPAVTATGPDQPRHGRNRRLRHPVPDARAA